MNEGRAALPQWRPMTAADLAGAHDLSTRSHPDFPERPDVLAEKFRLFPRGCFVLDDSGAGVAGYCFSHPWEMGAPPALDTMLQALPLLPAAYFVHDVTVDPSLRRMNLASSLVPQLVEIARSFPVAHMTLVAVSGSEPFWTRSGFHRTTDEGLQDAARRKYGAGAVHMTRNIA